MRGDLAVMTFSLALIYGVLVSSFNWLFGIVKSGRVRKRRLMASALTTSLIMGALGATFSIALGILPYNFMLFSAIIGSGAIQGLVGGYLSGVIWEKYVPPFMSER
jgi:hypothetical protein